MDLHIMAFFKRIDIVAGDGKSDDAVVEFGKAKFVAHYQLAFRREIPESVKFPVTTTRNHESSRHAILKRS